MKQLSSENAKRFSTWALIFVPLGLLLGLIVINPRYYSELLRLEEPFIVNPYLPCGWLVLLVGLGLIGVAAISNLVVDRYFQMGWPLLLVKTVVFLLFLLPACFMLVLGPAAFQIVRAGALR